MNRSRAPQRDLPGLDGLRAVAVALVVMAHSVGSFAQGSHLRSVAERGGFGVTIFFVLSGYLATHLLLREEDRAGRVAVGRFLLRRAIRILPPLAALIAVLAALAGLGWVALSAGQIAASLLLVGNLAHLPWIAGHLWFLAADSQVYAAWVIAFAACRTTRRRAAVAALAVVLAPVWRWFACRHAVGAEHLNWFRADLRYDPILIGGLLALAGRLPSWERCLGSRAMRHPLTSCLALAALIGTFTPAFDGIPRSAVLGPTLQSLCVAIVINQVVRAPGGWPTRLLSLAAVAWVGRLSYSLYLWQQLFCARAWPGVDSRFLHLPWNLAPIAATAILSYYVVEKPFFGLRARFRPRFRPLVSPARAERAALALAALRLMDSDLEDTPS